MKIYDWKKFITFLAVVLLFAILILYQCSRPKLEVQEIQEYEVQSGETLWSIASDHRPSSMSIQEYIYNLRTYNHKTDCTIYPNEVLKLIIYEEV